MPTISRAAPKSSRLAGSSRATPSLARTTSQRATDNNANASRRGTTTTALRAPGTISERSTLQSFRDTSTSANFRGNSGPNEPLGGRGSGSYGTHSHSTFAYHGGSHHWDGGRSYHPSFHWGHTHGWGWNFGFGFGFGHSWLYWNYPGHFYYPHYFGHHHNHHFAHAFLVGHAWHIVPFDYGWCGYNWGGHCSYWSFDHHHHCFDYHGIYHNVCRPYWYGFARWYDYSPYDYSYITLSYDSLYDDGYDDGYDRGYEDGAEDASAYSDDRRRDKIGGDYSRNRPDSDIDRARTNAPEEYKYEMERGLDAFGRGDYQAATKAFKEAVIISPDSADARYSLSMSAFAEGKYSFAAFALRRGVTLDAAGSNIDMAKAFGDPVVFKGYVDSLSAELANNPEDADLLMLSGFIALRTGDAAAAADKLDRAIKAAPQDQAAKTLHREAMEALEQD